MTKFRVVLNSKGKNVSSSRQNGQYRPVPHPTPLKYATVSVSDILAKMDRSWAAVQCTVDVWMVCRPGYINSTGQRLLTY